MHHKTVFEIDGSRFATLEEFFEEVSRVLIPGARWGRNLDAFDDILEGGFGTPEEGFVLRWRNSSLSRKCLGYAETLIQLQKRLAHCHPTAREHVIGQIKQAESKAGPTVFDWLVEIIQIHCSGGREQEDGVELELIEGE